MEQSEQLQLSLPYKEIKSVMGRKYYRDNFAISSKESYKIPVDKIQVRDGYNKRTVYEEMESLVEWVKANTEYGIVELDPLPVIEITNEGEIFILRGHRRLKGIQIAISEGLEVDYVVCTPAQKDINEFDRAIDIYTSNMHQSKLKPIEQAELVFDVKNNFGKISNEEIGKRLGVSRQTVDNLLLISEASDNVKNEIKVGNMSFTDAVAFVRSQKKLKKESDKKEEEAGQSSMYVQPDPKDSLRDEVAELEAAELQAEIYREREANRSRIEVERLERIANHLEVKEDVLLQHIGKRLAADATYNWVEDFIDKDTAEVVPVNRTNTVLKQGELLDENTIKDLVGSNVEKVYVFKEIIPTVSVITEPVAEAEKSIYDTDRPEVAAIQKVIQGIDKIEAIVTKLDVPDDVKKDICYQVYWAQRNASEAREFIHKNKKQNKSR